MRMRGRALAAAAAAALAVAVPSAVSAHPDHGDTPGSGARELFPGEGVELDKQHDGDEGHLPARQEGVTLVGKGEVTNPSGAGNTGRIADVFAYGDYAYLTAFREPTCEQAGVHVMDISDLSSPTEITDAFIPTSVGNYAGEGIQVIRVGERDVLIHQNETCPTGPKPAAGAVGGINLWDVTEPTDPQPLAMHAGDKDGGVSANTVHSMYAWKNVFDGKTYVVLVDNEESTDVDILDISNPAAPVMVNDTLDLVSLFGVDQESPENLKSIFSHDMMVYKVGARYVMTMNYWDGGYVLLDVTNPMPGRVSLIAESDYAELDEERAKRGDEVAPEGNAHQSELSPDRRWMIGTDEDFAPTALVGTLGEGPYAGQTFTAVPAGGAGQLEVDEQVSDDSVTFVGLACNTSKPAPADGGGIALVERGACSFQEKLDNVAAAGYELGIVFNTTAGCNAQVSMLANGDLPFVFVPRSAGLKILGVEGAETCSTPAGDPREGSALTLETQFNGWGYVRLFETDIPKGKKGGTGTISQVDTYAVEESQDPAYADGFGDLSVHEVAIDPDRRLAYLSYYAAGLRVVEYGPDGLEEVGVFIDEGGNNFWGVEVYQRDGETYVLASDRDYGLYVFTVEGQD